MGTRGSTDAMLSAKFQTSPGRWNHFFFSCFPATPQSGWWLFSGLSFFHERETKKFLSPIGRLLRISQVSSFGFPWNVSVKAFVSHSRPFIFYSGQHGKNVTVTLGNFCSLDLLGEVGGFLLPKLRLIRDSGQIPSPKSVF